MMEIREIDDSGKPKARIPIDELAAQAGRKKAKRWDDGIIDKVPEAEPTPMTVDPTVVKSTFKIGFQAGYVITNFEGWKLSAEEADHLQKAWQPIFDKYIAPRFAEYVIVFNAFGALGTVLFKKLTDQRKWQDEQKKKLEGQPAAQPGTTQS